MDEAHDAVVVGQTRSHTEDTHPTDEGRDVMRRSLPSHSCARQTVNIPHKHTHARAHTHRHTPSYIRTSRCTASNLVPVWPKVQVKIMSMSLWTNLNPTSRPWCGSSQISIYIFELSLNIIVLSEIYIKVARI